MERQPHIPDGRAEHPDFEPVGLGRMEPATLYTTALEVGDQDVIVVPSESDVLTAPEGEKRQYCVMGSRKHVDALRAKVNELRADARRLEEEKRAAEERARDVNSNLNAFQQELNQFASHDPSEASHHHTEDVYGTTKIAIIDAEAHDHDSQEHDHFPIHPPSVRQYLSNGVLHREEGERKTSWTELFWDLVMVGVVSKLSHQLGAEADSAAIGHFILLFALIFRIWVDMHQWINMTGSDDAGHRFYLAFEMIIVLGLGANSVDAFDTTGTTFAVFYCISRFVRVLMYTWMDYLDPRFRLQFTLIRTSNFISGMLLLVSVFVGQDARTILWIIAATFDFFYYAAVVVAMRRLFTSIGYLVALNIEHQSERMGLFVIIVLGESIIGALYDNLVGGVALDFLKAVLGLLVAYTLHWIYFTVDGSRQYQHAIRRSGATSFLWNFAHVPLCAALVAAGGVLRYLVSDVAHTLASGGGADDGHQQARIWIYCVGCAIALYLMAFIGILHKSADKKGTTRLSKETRLTVRVVVATIWVVTPLFHLSSTGVLAVIAATGIPVSLCEAWGRLRAREDRPRRRSFWRTKTFQVKEQDELNVISGAV